jgi:hypothetical protein
MTKFRSQERHRPELEMGIFDKVYNSFSVDFWLIAANLVVVTNWFMHPQSLGAISLLAVGLGLVIFAVIITDRRAQQLFRQFKRDYRTSGLLTLILGLVVAVTVFNYATDPSQALILTTGGQTGLKKLLGGGTAAVGTVIDSIFLVFKALFFISFMWALYKAYEKYTDQADLGDVIKTPLILLLVIGLIDGAATVFLGA